MTMTSTTLVMANGGTDDRIVTVSLFPTDVDPEA